MAIQTRHPKSDDGATVVEKKHITRRARSGEDNQVEVTDREDHTDPHRGHGGVYTINEDGVRVPVDTTK
jgi:hypothetical protein